MRDDVKSLDDLHGKAPLAEAFVRITLITSVESSKEPDKFVFTFANGHNVSPNVDVTKAFKVVGCSVEQVPFKPDLVLQYGPRDAQCRIGEFKFWTDGGSLLKEVTLLANLKGPSRNLNFASDKMQATRRCAIARAVYHRSLASHERVTKRLADVGRSA